jgi:hypothetical protein
MDDQEARAKWCHDFGYALRANQADLNDITKTVKELQDPNLRASLSFKCAELPAPIGGEEIANKLVKFIDSQSSSKNLARKFLFQSLRYLAIGYRAIVKQKPGAEVSDSAPIFSDSTSAAELHKNIRSGARFEHMIAGASSKYQVARKAIADIYYN